MPKGLKRVAKRLADGSVRVHWYHRATGKPLQLDPATAEGHLEVAALDGRAATLKAASDAPKGSYAELWRLYTAKDSEAWTSLKPRTRSDYQKVRDWIGDEAADRMILAEITPVRVQTMRSIAIATKGRRFGNYVVQVLRLTWSWAIENGHAKANPAMKVKLMRRPRGLPKVNRAWKPREIEAYVKDCPLHLLVPFGLGLYAGMREGDAVRVTWAAHGHNSGLIEWIAGKNGEDCAAPVDDLFRVILDAARAKRKNAVQIAVNSYGQPWTESGFRASFFKRLRKLEAGGLISSGCTFHGLRHTVAKYAREHGHSDSRVAAAIGDTSTAMAGIYGRDADRIAAQVEVLGGVQKHFGNIHWKPPAK